MEGAYGSIGGCIIVPYPRGVGMLGSLALANDILVQHIIIASDYKMMVEDIQTCLGGTYRILAKQSMIDQSTLKDCIDKDENQMHKLTASQKSVIH